MPIHKRLYRRLEARPRGRGLGPALAIARYCGRYALRGTYPRAIFYLGFAPALVFSLILYVSTREPHGFARLVGGLLRAGNLQGPADMTVAMWQKLAAIGLNHVLFVQSWVIVLITGFVGAKQIAEDVKSHAFEVYLTRPIRPLDYLLGKLLVVMKPLLLITWVPVLLLALVTLALLDGALPAAWPVFLKALGAGLFIALVNGMCVLGVSSLTNSQRYALVIWFCLYFVSLLCFGILVGATNDPDFVHVAFRANVDIAVQWILGMEGRDIFDPERPQEYEVEPALVILGVLVALSALMVLRRASRSRRAT